jgi:transcriptional regulator
MFTRPFFEPDRAASLAFAAARGFGTVCAYDGGKPVASALPFCLEYLSDGTPCVAFHVARGNALAALADGKSSWLFAVNGADAYVSPHWYASPDQVPTWLYQAVHLSGPVRAMTGEELTDHLAALSAKFESWLAPKPPWTASEVTTGRRQAMMQAIVGLVMTVEEIEGSFKLNQHKSDVDHAAITNALALQADASAQQLAGTMRGMRPQAFPTEQAFSNEQGFSNQQVLPNTQPEGSL